MSRFRKIQVSMYADAKYLALSSPPPNAKSLWVHLLTGPHTNAIPGLCCVGEAAMAEELRWPLGKPVTELPDPLPPGWPRTFREAYAEIGLRKMAVWDTSTRVLWIPNGIRYNPPENPNVVKGWGKAIVEIPQCPLRDRAVEELRAFVYTFGKGDGKAFREAFDKAFGKGLAKQEQEQEQEQEGEARGGQASGPAGGGDESDGLADARAKARDAFDRWSHRERRHGLLLEANEHAAVNRLVEQCAESIGINRGPELIPRQNLIPQAVEHLVANNRPFKNVDYAAGAVRKELDEWTRLGVPGAGRSRAGQPAQRPARAVLATAMMDPV